VSTEPTPKPAPLIEIAPTPGFPNALRVRFAHYANKFDLWWGDHKNKTPGPASGNYATHLYARPGTYNVAVFKPGGTSGADFLQQRTVAVRGSAAPLGIEFAQSPDDPDSAEARFVETDDSTGLLPHFHIEWPDGTIDEAWAVPGQTVRRSLGVGDHAITVYDTTSGLEGTFHLKLDAEQYDPNFGVEKAPQQDEHQRTARVKLTTVTETKPVLIYWGDERGGDPQRIASPKAGQAVDHTYDRDGSYPVLVVYEDGTTIPELGLSLNVTVPWGSRD